MLHPLVIHGEAVDAVPDAPSEELERVALRPRATQVEQLLRDAVLPAVREVPPNELAPRGVLDELFLDRLRGPLVGSEVAEQEGPRPEVEEPPERREVVLEVEGGGGRDGDQDLVPGEVQTRRVPRVHGS